jgi:hypothetical protein
MVFLVAALGAAAVGFSGMADAGIAWSVALIVALVALGVGIKLSLGRGEAASSSHLRDTK